MKFSIITPCYNSEKFIERCILSVMNQSHDDFEHIIVDGASTDGTLDIIRSYEGKYPMRFISEPDRGMYDAINKGFSMASGEIYAWLNSDDEYMPWALRTVNTVMECRSDISWCTGRSMYLNGDSIAYFTARSFGPHAKNPVHIKKGWADGRIMPFVMQECTFWKKELWDSNGGIDPQYKAAGDYYLWKAFAQSAELFTLNTPLAAFRRHDGQITSDMKRYYDELPKLRFGEKLFKKTQLLSLYEMLFKPYNKRYLIQPEKYSPHARNKQ